MRCPTAAVLALVCLWAQTGAAEDEAAPVRNLRLPLKHYADGRVRIQFLAQSARVLAQGALQATDARLEVYGPDGGREAVIRAERCDFDRQTGMARSDTAVRLERANMIVTGVGMEWEAAGEVVKILRDVRVVLRGPANEGRLILFPLPGARRDSPARHAETEDRPR